MKHQARRAAGTPGLIRELRREIDKYDNGERDDPPDVKTDQVDALLWEIDRLTEENRRLKAVCKSANLL